MFLRLSIPAIVARKAGVPRPSALSAEASPRSVYIDTVGD